ncbi:MAG: hypothetical protein JEY99_16420 [Spirochaetales bacterium]|nr:hypothetical protein [Spirochaetales bacterium]
MNKKINMIIFLTCHFWWIINAQNIEWNEKANLPKPMRGTAISCNNKIYFFEANHKKSGVYEYSPINDIWLKVSNMITPGWNINLAEIEGIIYVIGGDPFRNRLQSYNPILNEWNNLTPMPTGRQHSNCSVVDEKIYVIGGLTSWTVETAKNEVYNPLSNSWNTAFPLPNPIENPIVATIEDKIYALCEDILWMYDPKLEQWEEKQKCPEWISVMFGSAVINEYFIIPGGQNINEKAVSCVNIYNSKDDYWFKSTELPKPIQLGGLATINEKIFIIGGCDSNFNAYDTVYEGILVDSNRD